MRIFRALITELSPPDSFEVTENQVYSAYFSTPLKAQSALAAAWKEKLGLHYVPPAVDGFMHEAEGEEGYRYFAEIASIDVE